MYNENYTPYDEYARESLVNEYYESEMQNYRREGLDKLSTIVQHPQFLSDIALMVSYGFFESHKPSENIVQNLDLSKLELLAIQENFDAFKEEYKDSYEFGDF